MESRLLCRELGLQLVNLHILRFLDHPKMECLALYDHIVFIADFLLYLLDFLTWESWHDTIDECGTYIAVIREPVLEPFVVGSEVVLPEFYVFEDTLYLVTDGKAEELNEAFIVVTNEEEFLELLK